MPSRASKSASYGAYQAKTHFSELLEKVEKGQSITITRHGNPVARMIPVMPVCTSQERRERIAQWRQTSRGLTLGGLRLSDLIQEGRR